MAVMMASPSMLEEFALGFSLAEGIIPDASHLYACELREGCRGGVEVDPHDFVRMLLEAQGSPPLHDGAHGLRHLRR